MAKVSGSARKKSAKGKTAASRKLPDFEAVRKKINMLVGGQVVGLVQSAIAEADKGHFAAMKYLFEMIGLHPTNGEEVPGDDSLAKT